MDRVFIAGAGYVGTVAARLLAQAGHAVDVGRRTPGGEPGSHAMDVLRPDTYPAALGDAGCVVYCVSADGFTEESYRDAYVTGLANVIRAAAAGRARRLVFVSSTGVFGQDDGAVVDESSPALPKARRSPS